jgi:tripartite-type tricarboxylate transporter receptor subunit TctC
LLITDPTFLINPHWRKVNYDPVTSFEPICHLALVIAVNNASPYGTLADFFDAARAKSSDLTPGVCRSRKHHVDSVRDAQTRSQSRYKLYPCPGGAPSINALLGEHVTSAFTDYPPVGEQLKAGELRVLAATSRTQLARRIGPPARGRNREVGQGREILRREGAVTPRPKYE